MSPKKRLLLICLMIVIILLGLIAMLYPMIAARYNESVSSSVRTEYEELMQDNSLQKEYEQILDATYEYNAKLYSGEIDRTEWDSNGYFEQLRIASTEVMAYIRIPKIGVNLPVFHGTEEESALQRGVGHLESTSLPVGGSSTHSVLSAHTGMAESKMFTDLTLLEPGDIFYVDVMGETLAYQILSEEDITVVLPTDISNIAIERDEDLVTLVTCTPYGINTHRLLVKGHRITLEAAEDLEEQGAALQLEDTTASVWTKTYLNTILNGILLSALFCITFILIVLLLRRHDRRRRRAARMAARLAHENATQSGNSEGV